jgi:hypothetical protein
MLLRLGRRGLRAVLQRLVYATATSVRIDGLWIGSFTAGVDQRAALKRACEALSLIATIDPRRYKRVCRLLKRILVAPLPGRLGQYDVSLSQCSLDDRFVASSSTDVSEIAATIIHEATHARLARWGIPYEPARRRSEHICLEEELAFASRLNDPGPIKRRVEQLLARDSVFWDDTDSRMLTESERVLRTELELPNWVVRLVLWLGKRAA